MRLSMLGNGWAQRLDLAARRLLPPDRRNIELRLEQVIPQLCQYLDLLVAWNRRLDLTAARSEDELVDLVLADALMLGLEWSQRGVAVDVGSGAGAPGIPLALLCPGLELSLVEPKAKRVAFLRTCAGSLALSNLTVQRARSDELPSGTFDIALSRATLPPLEWLDEGTRLAKRVVWVLLARGQEPSCVGWRLSERRDYSWPLTGGARRLLRYEPCDAG